MAETTYNPESDLRRTASKAADTASNMASQAAENVSSVASDIRQKAMNKLLKNFPPKKET